MGTQRSGRRSRRWVLGSLATTASLGLSGCSFFSAASPGDGASGTRAGDPVSILAAGSLQRAFSNGLREATSVPLQIEARGSVAVARLVASGHREPDITAVADVGLFDSIMDPAWSVVFASNAVVLAYNPETEGGSRIAATDPDRWFEPLVRGTASFGRTDPDLDPLGYRTRFVLDLASRYYDASGLGESLLSPEQVYPETSLMARLETGDVDAAFTYRNMAVEHGYEFIEFPSEIDLSDPAYDDNWYSTVSYDLADGQTVEGGPISYGATIVNENSRVTDVFRTLTSDPYLEAHGFVVPDGYPTERGTVPDDIY